jgi:type VI secretion system protein ImpL
MKRLFGFLGARWFLTLVGTAALAALVWFVGPLFGFAGREPLAPEAARWWVIGTLFAVWAMVRIVSAIVARIRNRRLMEQLAAGPEPAPDPARVASQEELETLRQRFDQAMGVLKGSEGRRRLGGRWVYQLPWYLIIGPPGCGKTTALVNSGLRFPLAEQLGQDAIHGIGGTRNCDWWFTDEAVILDTAGRYTTQDSYAEVDSAAWGGFLGLLKKHRPRRPINGVLVAVSLSDLLQQSQAERDAHARAIRGRVQEIYTTFKIRCPVYVLFMKADLVAGFSEFFADLGQEARGQVWGMTFPYDDCKPGAAPGTSAVLGGKPSRGSVDAFATEHRALVERLDQRLLARMQQERDAGKRGLVFSFPRQFGSLGETLGQFLDAIFAPNRFEARPLVRGVYFTSGTQTGTPIDRVLGAIAANFGLGRQGAAPFAGTAKSFFVTRLLREVVFQEAGLAGLDPRLERRRLWLRRGAYAGTAGIALLAAVAWTTSYSRNRSYVAEVAGTVAAIERQIEALAPQDRSSLPPPGSRDARPSLDRDPLGVLPLLDAARAIPGGYGERDAGAPWSMGLGLYQGGKLGSQAARAYRRLLHKALLPRVMLRLEDQIRPQIEQAGTDPDYLYDALRVYLMLDDADRYNPGEVQLWVTRDWERNLPRGTTKEQQDALRQHLGALLEERPSPLPLVLDGQLIEGARGVLNDAPLATRIYARLQREGVGGGLPDFTIAGAAGDLARLVLIRPSGKPMTQGIPALYTYAGYHRGFDATADRLIAAAAEDAWVLGPQARVVPGTPEALRLIGEVRERYLQDYVDQWDGLLKDVGLVQARDIQHAAEIARILADPKDSPLRRLLSAAADETELDRPMETGAATGVAADVAGDLAAHAAARALNKAGGTLSGLRQRVERYFDDAQAGPAPAGEAPEAYVSRRFAWLRDLVRASAGRPAPMDGVQQELAQLQLHLSSIAAAESSGRSTLAAGEGPEIQAAKQAAARLPQPVGSLLATLVQDSATLVAGGARANLNNIWTSKVLPFCREAINDRYPFVKGSRRETTPQDFARLLGPGGLLDAFFSEHLSKIADTSRRTWRWAGGGIGIPDAVLAQFQRAATIREAFFAGGGKAPAVSFELTPTRMDAGASQLIVDVGGQIVDYRHGPLKAQALQWPSPEGIGRARLVLTSVDGKESSITEEGAWAWFRLLDRSRMQATGQEELFRVRFSLPGLSADLDLRAASVRNPFQLEELRGFRCPERL